jgi:hypothetical protein
VTFFLSKKSRELAPENQNFILFSLSTFLRRVCEGASFSFSPPAFFFNPDPKILQELASKVGKKKRGPAGSAQMATKIHS